MGEDAEKEELKGFLGYKTREDGSYYEDVEELYRLVKKKYSASRLEGFDLMLWGDLYTLFESDEEDEIWKNQHEYNLISWRLCDFCVMDVVGMVGLVMVVMQQQWYFQVSVELKVQCGAIEQNPGPGKSLVRYGSPYSALDNCELRIGEVSQITERYDTVNALYFVKDRLGCHQLLALYMTVSLVVEMQANCRKDELDALLYSFSTHAISDMRLCGRYECKMRCRIVDRDNSDTDDSACNDNDIQEKKKQRKERQCDLFDDLDQKLLICKIIRFEMIKYSFGQEEEYVPIKEYEYDDLTKTNEDACHAYQEIFRSIDEGIIGISEYEELRKKLSRVIMIVKMVKLQRGL
ncbi:hypothetical protein Tco_0348184 [Tanacetum coccineum]